MLTPQEVSRHSFSKASFGGYNMSMVDDFLDQLTVDYTALYKENALLKKKMKTQNDTIEEYRLTESAMRKALLSAQQMADDMVKQAEERKSALIKDAEREARSYIKELERDRKAEELRLAAAKENTAAFLAKLTAMMSQQEDFVEHLSQLVPPEEESVDRVADVTGDIDAAIAKEQQEETPAAVAVEEDAETTIFDLLGDDTAAKKKPRNVVKLDDTTSEPWDDRFSNLKFGKDYEETF